MYTVNALHTRACFTCHISYDGRPGDSAVSLLNLFLVAAVLKVCIQNSNTQLRHHKLEAALASLETRLGCLYNVDARPGVVVPEGILGAGEERQLRLGARLDALKGNSDGHVSVVGRVVASSLPDERVLLCLAGYEEDRI